MRTSGLPGRPALPPPLTRRRRAGLYWHRREHRREERRDAIWKKTPYFVKLTESPPSDVIRLLLRWYYRKIRWVNATEEPLRALLQEPLGMLPQGLEDGKPGNGAAEVVQDLFRICSGLWSHRRQNRKRI